jgi:hypothetical protein
MQSSDMPTPITWNSGVKWSSPGVTWNGFLPDVSPDPVTPPLPACLTPIAMTLNTSIDFLKNRVDKTRSVQTQIAATWLWPLRTVAQWQADGAALDKSVEGSLANLATEAHTKAEAARGDLDTRQEAIHAQTVAVVGVMRVRSQRQPELQAVVDELSARADSRDGIEKEGTACLSAWKLEFGGEAFVPAPGLTYAGFRELFSGRAADPAATPPVTALPSLRVLKEAYSDNSTIARRERGRLNVKLSTVERDCQDWYAEATKVFVAGTEIGDLIRAEVPTSDQYGTSTPPPPVPVPTP